MTKYIAIENRNRGIAGPLKIKYCDNFLTQLRGFTFHPKLMLDEANVTVAGFNSRRTELVFLIDAPRSVHVLREELKLKLDGD